MLQISSLSTELIRIQVTNNRGLNPVGSTVSLSFVTQGNNPTTWTPASWLTLGQSYFITLLVGPNGNITLPVGTYTVWTEILSPPETVIRPAGQLQIF